MKDEKKVIRKEKKQDYQFCEICRLNHNQGNRHKYFPAHKSAVSGLLTRFRSKLDDVRFFLKYPKAFRPENAQENGFWCLFCNRNVLELGPTDASCGNVIEHLASVEHWKKVKEFMWKHGPGMEGADVFRISELDFEKWGKKLESIKNNNTSVKRVANGPLIGPVNDIHNELSAEFTANIHEPLVFNTPNSVVPLRAYTNEKAQVSSSICEAASLVHVVPGGLRIGDDKFSKISAGDDRLHGSSQRRSSLQNGSVDFRETAANGYGEPPGLHHLTRISHPNEETTGGNIHTGAPPPWLDDATDTKKKPVVHGSSKPVGGRHSKLNPKRVGAAWAERRKLEMESERRGEAVPNDDDFDSNWLPSFGGVWHSGTRREFMEKAKKGGLFIHSDQKRKIDERSSSSEGSSSPIQPYIRKRKVMDGSPLKPS